jgi:hypothetical protein
MNRTGAEREMTTKKPDPTEILEKLRIVDVLLEEGQPLGQALRSVRMTESTYSQWRTEYDGLLRTLGPTSGPRAKLAKRARPGLPNRQNKAPH